MSWRDAAIEHPDVVLLATRSAEPFHRAKPIPGLLQLVTERNRQLAVRRRDRIREGQHVTIPIRRPLEPNVDGLTVHRDAEMHRDRRFLMLDAREPSLHNRCDDGTERTRPDV